jgi:hypothetical protein
VIDQVVDAVVAVDDARLALGRQMARQPFDEPVHCRLLLGLRGLVLAAPAPDLARQIVPRAAELGESHRDVIDGMQRGDDGVHRLKHRPALGGGEPRQARIPEDAAVEKLHDVKGAADDRVVFA